MSDGDAAQPASSSKTSRALLQQDLDTQKDASGDGGADGDDKDGGSSSGVPPAECPICRFIEAGPCGGEHRTWFTCRADAKETGEDFVQRCATDVRSRHKAASIAVWHHCHWRPHLACIHTCIQTIPWPMAAENCASFASSECERPTPSPSPAPPPPCPVAPPPAQFRAFFSCMLAHQQYYEPFLEAFHVDTERSQEALDAAAATDNMHQRQSDGTGGSAEKQK